MRIFEKDSEDIGFAGLSFLEMFQDFLSTHSTVIPEDLKAEAANFHLKLSSAFVNLGAINQLPDFSDFKQSCYWFKEKLEMFWRPDKDLHDQILKGGKHFKGKVYL
jgi:hypothetical protein